MGPQLQGGAYVGNPNIDRQAMLIRSNGYGTRADGSPKGVGYFGEIPGRGGVMTELGANSEMGGKDVHYPLINPGLNRAQIDHLASGGKPDDAIYDASEAFAKLRIAQGKSPFAGRGEMRRLDGGR